MTRTESAIYYSATYPVDDHGNINGEPEYDWYCDACGAFDDDYMLWEHAREAGDKHTKECKP